MLWFIGDLLSLLAGKTVEDHLIALSSIDIDLSYPIAAWN